ncbi:outer membrane lipoprotein-sorting protein [Candidatus Binatia bacterium]|nr:outer membrane lipoprotein-sorting protein [Candidatus Binatia bacterium]
MAIKLKCGAAALCAMTVTVLAAGRPAAAQDVDARELVKRVMEALPKASFKSKVNLTTPSGPRLLELDHKFVDGARASYLELLAPEQLKGIRFLFVERLNAPSEQYMKVAAAKTIVRVANEVRKQPFLNSTFYIADLIEPALDDSTYKYVGEENLLGRRCMLVEATPKDPEKAIYGKTVLALDPKDLLALRRQFYDHKGKILKVWTVETVEKIDGIWTLKQQRMTNTQTEEQSRIDVQEIKYNVELPDSMFVPKYLLH